MTLRIIPVVLCVVLLAGGSLRADDDDDRGRDFEKRYREQQKRSEERRREDWKKHQERQREWNKKQEENFKKRDEWYREDRKRQEEAQRDWDERRREDYRRQLRDNMRNDDDDDRNRRRSRNWWVPSNEPVYRPGVAIQYSPLVVNQISPFLSGTLEQAWQDQRLYGPDFRRYATELSQRGQRLTELAQQGRDAAAMRGEFAAFDADWQRVMEPLQQAAMHNEESRLVAWQVYQSGRQLRQAIGFDRASNPDWSTADAMVPHLINAMAQLDATLQRDFWASAGAEQLLYDVRSAWRESATVAEMIRRRDNLNQIREQHGYFVVTFEQVVQRVRDWRVEANYRGQLQQVARIDRRLCDALGIHEAASGDFSRVLVDHAAHLSATTDRLRKLVRHGLGEGDAQVTSYYIQPSDQWAYQSGLLAQALEEGRDPYVVLGGWAMIEQLAPQAIQRVEALDATRFILARELAREGAAIMGQMRLLLSQ